MGIFFTSDQHFQHKLTTRLRGFESPDAQDEVLIDNWNKNIKKNDQVYFLGDFSFTTKPKAQEIFNRLNGKIYCIKGNHDNMNVLPNGFVWIKDVHRLKIDKKVIWLSHYPHVSWPHSYYGSLHLYGHVHGRIPISGGKLSFDVGVDMWNLTPICLEEVFEIYLQLKIQWEAKI